MTTRTMQLSYKVIDNILALTALILLNFLLPRWLPGDPIDYMIGEAAVGGYTDQQLMYLKEQFGLNQSPAQQFAIYLYELSQGNLGYSVYQALPVLDLILQVLPWTLFLVLGSIPLALLIGVWPGLLAGCAPNSPMAHIGNMVAAVFSSFPSFAMALILLKIFSVSLGWLPFAGGNSLFPPESGLEKWLDILLHATLPILTLALHSGGRYFYLAQGIAQQIQHRPFIQAAQNRGITGKRLLWHYYVRNALPILLTKIISTLPMALGATVFIEVVFSYPGIGSLLLESIENRDYPVIQGCLFGISILVLILNTMLDIVTNIIAQRG